MLQFQIIIFLSLHDFCTLAVNYNGMKKASQQKTWAANGREIQVNFRKVKKSKHIRIHVSSPERVLVTGSPAVPFRDLELFFQKNQTWVQEKILHFQKFPNKNIQLPVVQYKVKKELARKLVLDKLTHWNKQYNFKWNQVAIRNQRTRWGSCSSKGTLSYHAGIVDLPESLQDYLVVHELCHLGALNHSLTFWTLVEKSLPHAKKLDAHLKKYAGTSIL